MRRIVVILFALILLTACGGLQGEAGSVVEVPVTVEIPVTVEVTVIPSMPAETATIEATAATHALPVTYYYFPVIPGDPYPAGSVAVLPGSLILSPALSNFTPSGDPATDVYLGLQAAINDPRNSWTGQNLKVDEVSYNQGQLTVLLSGEVFGTGDVVLIAARWQLLLTIFSNDAVQSAVVMLNGDSIANLGTSFGSQAKPAGYLFTRAEIESFIQNNANN